MKTLESIKDKLGTFNKAGEALGIHPHQVARLISKGALYNDIGEIYIPSKTKIKREFFDSEKGE